MLCDVSVTCLTFLYLPYLRLTFLPHSSLRLPFLSAQNISLHAVLVTCDVSFNLTHIYLSFLAHLTLLHPPTPYPPPSSFVLVFNYFAFTEYLFVQGFSLYLLFSANLTQPNESFLTWPHLSVPLHSFAHSFSCLIFSPPQSSSPCKVLVTCHVNTDVIRVTKLSYLTSVLLSSR